MPIASITFEVSGDATQRRIVYTGTDGKGQSLAYGPVITTDRTYDPTKALPAVEAELNTQLKQQEIDQWLRDPSQAPPLVEATKEDYYAVVTKREQAAAERLTEEQAKVDAVDVAKEKVAPLGMKISQRAASVMSFFAPTPPKEIIKEVIVEKRVEVPIERIVEIEKIVEVPVEKIIEKEVRVEVPVEKIVHVDRPIPYPVEIEKLVYRDVEIPIPPTIRALAAAWLRQAKTWWASWASKL